MNVDSTRSRDDIAAIALMCLAGAAWAVSSAFARILPADVPVQQMVWGRYAVHIVVVVAFLGPIRGLELFRTARAGQQVGRGLMMLAMPVFFVLAAIRLPVGDVWTLTWVAPVVAMAMAAVVLREPVGWRSWVGTAMGLAGMGLYFGWTRGGVDGLGLLFGVGSAVAFAVFQVMTRVMKDEATSTGVLFTALCIVVPLTPVPGVVERPSVSGALIVVALGLSWLVVLVALDESLKRASVARVAPWLYSSLIWSVLIGRVVFDDPLTRRSLAAVVCVGAGLACCALPGRNQRAGARPPGAGTSTDTGVGPSVG